ncbi:MAG: ABC transporter substrate-binding protein [candidate division KSB1 bacterium]|nr:ABC transporter substrate-binding protein [candidate division KSB1 bacterium]MDZ7367207.1 ABC transporter substrate-binding protein [candidate division KSB1 bacterium]MDZ7405310.1 ABC transporter substrate-binding protein [candidate division KSB1 bacterium]
MKRMLFYHFAVVMLLCSFTAPEAFAQRAKYLDTPKSLSAILAGSAKSVRSAGAVKLPVITWGGDIATIYANGAASTQKGSIFDDAGLAIEIFREDNFVTQAQKCLDGETPYLRGTMGMINLAGAAFAAKGVNLVPFYQLTWSTGGDAMVVRGNIKRVRDLRGKKIALQAYGPHLEYLGKVLADDGLSFRDVTLAWLPDLTLPPYDTKGVATDPASAMRVDPTIDAAMVIIPDALALTSGGNVGTGAEMSVKGAKILLTTKTASRIIADVYAVRSDYLERNRSEVEKLTHGLLRAQEALQQLQQQKSSRQAENLQLLGKAADILLGSPQATADAEALLGDCEFVGYPGNVAFFTGQGTLRNFERLTNEIQSSLLSLGLLSAKAPLNHANWDYAKLAVGLKNTAGVTLAKPAFDPKKVEKKLAVETETWAEEGTLFLTEINFEPNQNDFPESKYAADFQKALELAQTYAGALFIVEGHSDPQRILQERAKGSPQPVINQMIQASKNLSYERAQSVIQSFLAYAKKRGIVLDESRLVAAGMGISNPKHNPPKTREEWAANRRVVFRLKQVEAEATEFMPIQ